MLISASQLHAQTTKPPADTVKKVTVVDTIPEPEGETLDQKVIYNARDSSRYEAANNKFYLYGDAYVEYGTMNLKAEFIEIDYSKNLITAYGTTDSTGKKVGTPVFKDAGQEFNAEKIMYNLKTKKGKIFNVLTKQGDLLVFGNEIKRDSTEIIYMKNLKCIPCQYEDAKTVFRATKAKIIPNDKIVTGPMFLEINGVPTPLVLPFGYFPNSKRRHNGIIIPFVGNSPTQGYFLKDGGFYWGISDKTDMTVKGDLYSNKSWGIRTFNNYNVLYKYSGSVNIGYSEYVIGDKDIPAAYNVQKSYNFTWLHTQDNRNNPSRRFSANVNYVNRKYNKFNAVSSGNYLTNTFQSNINFTKTLRWGSVSVNATHSQNTITKLVDISFPQLTFNVNRFFPFKRATASRQNIFDKLGISYLFEARNTYHTYDSLLFRGDISKNMSYGVRHSIPISTNFNLFKYITVTPSINLSSVMYMKTAEERLIATSANTYMIKTDTVNGFKAGFDANFSTAMNTKVFMDYVFRGKRLKQIRHLLIPTLSYLYRPDFGAQQYGFYKKYTVDTLGTMRTYSIFQNTIFGGPAAGKQNALSLNLNNNLEAKIRKKTDTGYVDKKVTLLQNLSLSGSYNFAADSFRWSNIIASARTKIWKFFDLVGDMSLDPYVYDYTHARNMNLLHTNYDHHLLGFSTAKLAINAALSSNTLKAMTSTRKPPSMTNGAEKASGKITDMEPMKWNLNIFYNITFDKVIKPQLTLVQSLNFAGDINLTKFWKVGVTSGYDFVSGKLTYTSFNIYRDLKCWEARISWIPFGFAKSYSITLNLKTSMLSDIKIPRQRQWYDNL